MGGFGLVVIELMFESIITQLRGIMQVGKLGDKVIFGAVTRPVSLVDRLAIAAADAVGQPPVMCHIV
jgi:hypothetical protein